jgi:hypothetical protein
MGNLRKERLEPRVYLSKAIGPKEASLSRLPDVGLSRFDPFATLSGNGCYLRGPVVHHSVIRTAKLRPIAVGPDSNVLIQIRDRLAAHAETLTPKARRCVCPYLRYQRILAPPRTAGVDASGMAQPPRRKRPLGRVGGPFGQYGSVVSDGRPRCDLGKLN